VKGTDFLRSRPDAAQPSDATTVHVERGVRDSLLRIAGSCDAGKPDFRMIDVTFDSAGGRELSDGSSMPMLGLGVWQVPSGRACVDAVRWALGLGYRHIDTAQAYGDEASVGQGLRDSGVPRDDVFGPERAPFPATPKSGRLRPVDEC